MLIPRECIFCVAMFAGTKVIVDERFKDIFDDKGRKRGKKDTGRPNNPRGVHTDFRSRTDMISAC